jgi:hypothetical protein
MGAIGLHAPSRPVELGSRFNRVAHGIEESGDERKGPDAKAFSFHPIWPFSHCQARRQWRPLLCRHPLGPAEGLAPLDALLMRPKLLQPLGARLPFVALAAPPRLDMGPARGEGHAVLLRDAAHGMRASLHEEGEMGLGTEAAISHQDIPGAQVRMASDHCREIMGPSGSRQEREHHPRPGRNKAQRWAIGNLPPGKGGLD